ncbi:hypothetical protein DFJ74DRAFT_772630 [Hyaloraphidium curvatum]|nr:hypothetical protein DFJ74DRAFT_772630 [Hyaloraphidium curvatum]
MRALLAAALFGALLVLVPSAGALPVALAPRAIAPAELAGLLRTAEEEKLAFDVYTALGAKWNASTNAFANIARSEARHRAAAVSLLGTYGAADPGAGMAPGEYADAGFRAAYADLVAKGTASLRDALEVGVGIEEMDIADLGGLLAGAQEAAVKLLYANLVAGSNNHLAAFRRNLAKLDGTGAGVGSGGQGGRGGQGGKGRGKDGQA